MKEVFALIIILFNNEGTPLKVWEPLPVFNTVQQCTDIIKTAPPVPAGYKVTFKCVSVPVPPEDVLIVNE